MKPYKPPYVLFPRSENKLIWGQGGTKKTWNHYFQPGQYRINNHPYLWKDSVKKTEDLKKYFELKSQNVLDPTNYKNLDDFIPDLEQWFIETQRQSSNTFNKRQSLIRSMANSPYFPIDWLHLDSSQIILHLNCFEHNYSKETPRQGADAVRNRWKTITMVAKAQGIDTDKWNYVPPSRGKPKHKIIPLPKDIYKIIHHYYSKDPYENALLQYFNYHSFFIGWRCPSEPVQLKLDHINIDDGYIHFYQPKVDEWRLSDLEPELTTISTRKSFKNWIDIHRPKVENQYSKDYVYLTKTGKPFTENYLRKYLNDHIKPVWEKFHPYVYRNWCYIARLIQHEFNIQHVKDWFDHNDYNSVSHYTKDARKYYRMDKTDWIRSVLKSHRRGKQTNIDIDEYNSAFDSNYSEKEGYGPMGALYPVSPGILIEIKNYFDYIDFLIHTVNTQELGSWHISENNIVGCAR